jgi:hypothetical protein
VDPPAGRKRTLGSPAVPRPKGRRADRHQLLAGAGTRIGDLGQFETIKARKRVQDDRAHSRSLAQGSRLTAASDRTA